MITHIKKYIGRKKQQRRQHNYDNEIPPKNSLSPEFTPLTHDQRELLFSLIRVSKKESYLGEFQWCIDTVPTNIGLPMYVIAGIKPGNIKTLTFDIDGPLFKDKDWMIVHQKGQMKALEDGGYISISSILGYIGDEQNLKKETWAHFCINQKAYNYYHFINSNYFSRLRHVLWEKTEKHFVTIIISITSGVIGALIINWLFQ